MSNEKSILILPNGDAILAEQVTDIRFRAAHEMLGQQFEPAVIVNGMYYHLPTDEEALSERDRLVGEWVDAVHGHAGKALH